MTPPYGRKRKGTEESLDETERGQSKSWFKTQHSVLTLAEHTLKLEQYRED